MRTLSILTAAAGILLAISGPGLAASRGHAQKPKDAYSSYARDTDNAYWPAPYIYGPNYATPDASAYGVQRRNDYPALGPSRDGFFDGPAGWIRNDW